MLHVLPRGGGILDQPADEMMKLEKIFEAYNRYEKVQADKGKARELNRSREHDPAMM